MGGPILNIFLYCLQSPGHNSNKENVHGGRCIHICLIHFLVCVLVYQHLEPHSIHTHPHTPQYTPACKRLQTRTKIFQPTTEDKISTVDWHIVDLLWHDTFQWHLFILTLLDFGMPCLLSYAIPSLWWHSGSN